MAEDRAWAGAADRLGGEVQVIVVQHDARLSVAAGLGHDLAREGVVEGDVASVPGAHRGRVDDRPLRQVPHLVLEEPQEGVGDDVVGLLVHRSLDRCESQADRLVVAERSSDQPRVRGGAAIALAHGGGDPGDRHALADVAEGGDEAARSATRPQRAVGRGREGHRASVGRDDQPPVSEERVCRSRQLRVCRCHIALGGHRLEQAGRGHLEKAQDGAREDPERDHADDRQGERHRTER